MSTISHHVMLPFLPPTSLQLADMEHREAKRPQYIEHSPGPLPRLAGCSLPVSASVPTPPTSLTPHHPTPGPPCFHPGLPLMGPLSPGSLHWHTSWPKRRGVSLQSLNPLRPPQDSLTALLHLSHAKPRVSHFIPYS